jgi:hypothetical protein
VEEKSKHRTAGEKKAETIIMGYFEGLATPLFSITISVRRETSSPSRAASLYQAVFMRISRL